MRAWDLRDVTLDDGRRLRLRCRPGRGTPRGQALLAPVAAVWGARDALVPREHADALLDALPRAHVEAWPGMGHRPQRERPEALAAFVEEHASRGAGAS